MRKLALLAAALSLTTACKKKSTEKTPNSAATGSAATGSAAMGSATAGSGSATAGSGSATAGSGSAAGAATAAWDGKSRLDIPGFQTPESVLWDPNNDVYLVSNINGKPLDADDNGFISRITPDGKVDMKWIDGAKDSIKLDAPKGMAISRGTLWVADINVVRKFDAKTGEPKGEVKIDGATFLNDVVEDGDGGIFVTDSGLDANFKSTGTDAVYRVMMPEAKVTARIKNKTMGAPNGVTHGPKGKLYVVTFGTGELYAVTFEGKKEKAEKLPKGQLDGIVSMELGTLLVSSWEGKAVYRGNPGGPWSTAVENVESPADIDWDANRARILIPSFKGNTVSIVPAKPE